MTSNVRLTIEFMDGTQWGPTYVREAVARDGVLYAVVNYNGGADHYPLVNIKKWSTE